MGRRFSFPNLTGAALRWRLQAGRPFLEPLSRLGLRASQVVVMPLLVCALLQALATDKVAAIVLLCGAPCWNPI